MGAPVHPHRPLVMVCLPYGQGVGVKFDCQNAGNVDLYNLIFQNFLDKN